jgi:hypothetical protein
MRTGEPEDCLAVVEERRTPRGRGVATSAIGWQTRRMPRVGRAVVLRHVAGRTLDRNPDVLTGRMAVRTDPCQVSPRQGKRRLVMIK